MNLVPLSGSGHNDLSVQVAVRIRPLLQSEINQNCSLCITHIPESSQIKVIGSDTFTFDDVFGLASEQCQVYDTCVSDLVEATLEGFNATILAYGQV